MSTLKKAIPIGQLLVNHENYRFEPVGDEPKAIDLMLKKKKREIVNLAAHIMENGLDEAKPFRVQMIESNKFLVLDGNRRTTAIKCLNDPTIISDEKLRTIFQNLIKNKKRIDNVDCIIYGSEIEAAKWIKLDHTGKNDGAGQDSWGSADIERFGYRFEGKQSTAMQAIKLVESELGKKIDKENLKITTINRILSTPEVREIIGLNLNMGEIEVISDKKTAVENLDKLFQKVINDDVKVGEVYTKQNRIDFVNSLFNNKEVTTSEIANINNNDAQISSPNNENSVDSEDPVLEDVTKKRKTSKDQIDDVIFGKDLFLKKGAVNNLYLAIVKVYNQNKNEELVLPIIGMSLRLLLDVAAREYYKEHLPKNEIISRDAIYANFLKVAKKEMGLQKASINYLSLTSDWLNDKSGLEGQLGKYAHGNIMTTKTDVLKMSLVVGEIVNFYFFR